MDPIDTFPIDTFLQEDSFRFIKPEEFEALGIDTADTPWGTVPALKHPSHLSSRFGGNAYGFGLFEVVDRLSPKDAKLIQSITFDNPENIRRHYRELNKIYKKIGLLIRFSNLGKPYYLIPVNLVSNTLTQNRAKIDEISKIVGFHRKKYFKEYYEIGLVTHKDDLIASELSIRFKELRFVVLDSLEKLRDLNQTLDLFILTRDLHEIILMEKFSPFSRQMPTMKWLNSYAIYILWKLYNSLKPDGEVFIIADHYTPKTNRTTKLTFKTAQEEKKFALFTHIFKTKRKYKTTNHSLHVNIFDFQKYLSGLYVEQEVVDKLLGGKNFEEMTLEQINKLTYLNFPFSDSPFLKDQEKQWARLLPIFFDMIFLKPLVPQSLKKEWGQKFAYTSYSPNYMMIFLGQKKALKTTMHEIKRDVLQSKLIGCPAELLADYRNSFEYVIRTLRVLDRLRTGKYKNQFQIYIDRLTQPLENKSKRFSALNDVLKLIDKISRLEKIRDYLNPDKIEGSKTKVLENLEILTFFDFADNELKEILFIVLGHTPFGRIISGKMNEKFLKPVSELARTYDPQQALNLLRYCLLMTIAETEAARKSELTQEEFSELFNLYESTVRVVTNRELDWDGLLDEKIISMGGIHNEVVRKLLKMTKHFEFLDNWSELEQKGPMEKESLSDYDAGRLSRIRNVIRLVRTIDTFEETYLKFDPLQLPVFYRKFLEVEFHGTGHIFERMDCQHVFTLLWITVNLVRGGVINFNPILADVETGEIDARVKKVEREVKAVNINYLDLSILRRFSEQLYRNGSSFIVGTGFHLKVDPKTHGLQIAYMDMQENIEQVEALSNRLAGCLISEIPVDDLKNLEALFSRLEVFHQGHQSLTSQTDLIYKLPARQKRWFQRLQDLGQKLRSNFLAVIFRPESLYTDLDILYRHAPSLLNHILPEFTALKDLVIPWHLYLKSPVTHYIITATRKLQALINHDKEIFQDIDFMHRLAQREFGPMATGIVGINESQIADLEETVERLRSNRPLFEAFIRSFIFQDLGRLPDLRQKYERDINPADLAQAGAHFVQMERIAERYGLDEKGKGYLIFLVRHHSLFHHIVRGEFSFHAIQSILQVEDKDLFDAFFVFSFIMLSAIREDLILEDLANRLFQIRVLCHRIIGRETTFEAQLEEGLAWRGNLFYALEDYQKNGLPEGITPSSYLNSRDWKESQGSKCIRHGKIIFAMERLLRLRGIRYVEFLDLVSLMLKVPLKFVYKKRKFSSIGYATFEKEIFEAFRIYNTLQSLTDETRYFVLDQLFDDKVRIFGYEKVSNYLSYQNQIKLLLAGLLGTKKLGPSSEPICLNFLGMSEIIERRYEAVNDYLNTLSVEKLWKNKYQLNHLFKAKTGLILNKEEFPNVLSLNFQDRVNISQRLSYMEGIDTVEQLKNYYYYSLRTLRKNPFYTDDYELQLEELFEKRLTEIAEMLLNQTKKQMSIIRDFPDLHRLVSDLIDRSWDLGLSDDHRHRLNDLYELRKDSMKREKLSEIESIFETIHDIHELNEYWGSVKWYLQSNRRFFGKEFEYLIAQKFDAMRNRLEDR
jgi:hypothetical protein